MRSRPLIWLLVSVMLFVTGAWFWRVGDKWAAERVAAPSPRSNAPSPISRAGRITPAPLFQLLSDPGTLNSPPAPSSTAQHTTRNTNPLGLRLSNTSVPVGQLARSHT